MNTNTTKATLSLKLPPEVAKIMPWVISAKASGKSGHSDWAKSEYERAAELARERERSEAAAEECRRYYEWQEQLKREEEERRRQAWLAEQVRQRARLDAVGAHLYLNETGEKEFLPSQSSQKGWRRLLSECPDLWESGRYGAWGCRETVGYTRRNRGRKPRKPWFKKTRA